MNSYWRRHLIVLSALLATWVIVLLIDRWLLAPGGSGWITLDLRGYLVVPYVILTTLYAIITTMLVVKLQPKRPAAVRVYSITAIVMVLVCALGAVIWQRFDERQHAQKHVARSQAAAQLAQAVSLVSWHPEKSNIHLVLTLQQDFNDTEIEVVGYDASGLSAASGFAAYGALVHGRKEITVPIDRYADRVPQAWQILLRFRNGNVGVNLEYSGDESYVEESLVVRPLPLPTGYR